VNNKEIKEEINLRISNMSEREFSQFIDHASEEFGMMMDDYEHKLMNDISFDPLAMLGCWHLLSQFLSHKIMIRHCE
jgi:hypothetical protein